METLRGFAVLSLLSTLVLSLLPDTKLKRTVQLVSSLLLLLSWLTALQTLLPHFPLPNHADTPHPLAETAGYSFSLAQSDAENALSRRFLPQEESP